MRQYFELWVDPFLTDLIKLYTFYTSANLIQKTKVKYEKMSRFSLGLRRPLITYNVMTYWLAEYLMDCHPWQDDFN